MNLITVTPPVTEPVTLAELYSFLRLDPFGSPPEHPDDAMLASMLRTARETVEQKTRRALVSQRLRLVLGAPPADRVLMGGGGWSMDDFYLRPRAVLLPKPPLLEVHAITYFDAENVECTLDPASYIVVADTEPAQVQLVAGATWPEVYPRADAFQVEYSAGYAPAGSPPVDWAANVPDQAKSAIKFEVQLQYDEIAPEKRDQIEATIDRLLVSLKMPKF